MEHAFGVIWDTNSDSFVYNMVGSSWHSSQDSEFDSMALWSNIWISSSMPGQSKNLSSRSLAVWYSLRWCVAILVLKGMVHMTRKAGWNFTISHPPTLWSCTRQPICIELHIIGVASKQAFQWQQAYILGARGTKKYNIYSQNNVITFVIAFCDSEHQKKKCHTCWPCCSSRVHWSV